jgi:thiol:disulfide interchange protein DsbA
MKQADAQIRAYQADVTPTIIVNGKYRLTPRSAGGNEQFISLVKWLVNREPK